MCLIHSFAQMYATLVKVVMSLSSECEKNQNITPNNNEFILRFDIETNVTCCMRVCATASNIQNGESTTRSSLSRACQARRRYISLSVTVQRSLSLDVKPVSVCTLNTQTLIDFTFCFIDHTHSRAAFFATHRKQCEQKSFHTKENVKIKRQKTYIYQTNRRLFPVCRIRKK